MKPGKMAIFVVVLAVVAPLLVGCATTMQAKKVEVGKSILVDPAVLERGTGDQALYRYHNPNVDWNRYTKIIMDPVIIYQEAELDAETRENYQKLANNAYVYFSKELEKYGTLVTVPEPDTMRVQVAILSAGKSGPVGNFMTTFIPVGMALSTVKYGATGKPMAVGEIVAELRITDSMTGQLIAAALDKRHGGKEVKGVFTAWQDADSSLAYWAQLMGYRICTIKGGANCVKPE